MCSSWLLFHDEVSKLKDIFGRNGYPLQLFDKCVKKFLSRKFTDESGETTQNDEKEYVISIPYVGYASDNLKKRITKWSKELNINTKVVFRSFRIGSYFSLKSATPKGLKANVVYEFQCSCDESMSYIGKTK